MTRAGVSFAPSSSRECVRREVIASGLLTHSRRDASGAILFLGMASVGILAQPYRKPREVHGQPDSRLCGIELGWIQRQTISVPPW